MRYRLYLPTDSERLKALYAEMGLAEIADLPLPEKDPCTVLGIVGQNGQEKADVAIFFRITTEAVLVVNPELPNQAQVIRGLIAPATVGLQLRDHDLRSLKLGGIDDVHAFIPVAKPNMMEFAEVLGFTPGHKTFKMFYRPIWKSREE